MLLELMSLGLTNLGLANLVQMATSYDDDSGSGWLLLAGPIAGVLVYGALYRFYRNTDKSHSYEQETLVEAQPVTGGDQKIEEVRGTTKRAIPGNNVSDYRGRVQRVQ